MRIAEIRARLLGSSRLTLALVGFLGCIVVYTLRSDVSFAIVCMVNGTANDNNDDDSNPRECYSNHTSDDDATKTEGDLLWSKTQQGYVLSSFFWGYIFSQIIGGEVSGRFGGKVVVGGSALLSSILTLLCPVCANTNVYLFITLRVILGFIQGVLFPALQRLWSQWAPPLERSFLLSLCYAGNQIGVTISMPISAVLCEYGFAGGWPSVYYVFGGIGILWSALWFFYVSDTPESHRFISDAERKYIQRSLGESISKTPKKYKAPWRSILKSSAVWGLWSGHFASDWGAYMMMTNLPTYMNDVLDLDLNSMGGAAAAPYIVYFVIINVGGFVADKIRSAGLLSTKATRKVAMIVAMGCQAGFLIASAYCGCGQKALVIVFITLGIGLSGFAYAGFVVNYLDISGPLAGSVLSIGNTLSCLGGIAGPLIVGAVTHSRTRSEWRIVFWITFVIMVIGTIIFVAFAQGELQPWAKVENDDCSVSSDENVGKKKPSDVVSTVSTDEEVVNKI